MINLQNLGRGLKAGAIAGFIIGVIMGVIRLRTYPFLPNAFYTFKYKVMLIVYPVFHGILDGILLGIIFALLYNKIPTKKSISKSLIFSSVFFGVILIALIIFRILAQFGILGANFLYELGIPYYPFYLERALSLSVPPPFYRLSVSRIVSALLPFIIGVTQCVLIGYFWGKFGKDKKNGAD